MGLRINTNQSSLAALRSLHVNERMQTRALERLSTGLKINRASDDPSGLVISEQLRTQLSALDQAVSNSQNAANLVTVADSALAKISDLLIGINESIVFALNTGASSADQIAAEQDAVDHAIAAIDRIASTTRYADQELLNGSGDYQLTSDRPSALQNLTFRSINFGNGDFSQDFTIEVNRAPEQAQIQFLNTSATAGATVRVTGNRGTVDVTFASGTTASGMATAINSVAGFTGVYASSTAGGTGLTMYSEEFGLKAEMRVEVINGTVMGSATTLGTNGVIAQSGNFDVGEVLFDRGREGSVTFEGQVFSGMGLEFSILTRNPIMEFTLDADQIGTNITSGSTFTFSVANTAVQFQLRELPTPSDRLAIGFKNMSTATLGLEQIRDKIEEAIANPLSPNSASATQIMIGGTVNSLKTGGGNDLFQNAANASHIVRSAIDEVSKFRAFLGAAVAQNIEPNIESLEVEIENLSASLSDIRDLDFAEESANFVKSQILFQSGIGVLASANAIPQSVLTLLGV